MTDSKFLARSDTRSEFLRGIRTIAPVIIGVIPFGMISGIAAVESGLSKGSAQLMAVVVFAGASQLAGVQLMSEQAPMLVIWMTTLMINLRFTMYSASLAPHWRSLPKKWKALMAYILTDQAYALSVSHYDTEANLQSLDSRADEANSNSGLAEGTALDPNAHGRRSVEGDRPASIGSGQKAAFYLGTSITTWVVWQLSSAIGIFLGASIPDGWSLGFAIPLVFMVLAIPAIKSRATAAAAVTAAVLSVVAKPLPFNMGLVVAALVGIVVGVMVERWLNGALVDPPSSR